MRPVTQYRHIQEAASTTWNIEHNLDTYPIVDVYVDNGGVVQKVVPKAVTYVDHNNCSVLFSRPTAGFATVI